MLTVVSKNDIGLCMTCLIASFPDVRWKKLIEESQVEAEGRDAAGCVVLVHAEDMFTEDFQQSFNLLKVRSIRMESPPFFGHPVEQADEKDP